MESMQLANRIKAQNYMSPAQACVLAWRILNEYPQPFQKAALELAAGGEPQLSAAGISLKDVTEISGARAFEALELLLLIEKDPKAGKNLIFRLGLHDSIVR